MLHALCCLAVAVVVGSSPIMIDLPFHELPETAPETTATVAAPEATTANNTPASQPIPSGPYGDVLELPPADNVTDSAFYSVVENYLLWPNGIVPYQFSSGVSTNLRNAIRNAMNQIVSNSCVRFQECSYCTDRVVFYTNYWQGCQSDYLGRKGGAQEVNIGQGCEMNGIIIHEILHAIGFYHEQARPDRDSYVRIVWENIKYDWRDQFTTYRSSSSSLGSFDYQSVMLYEGGNSQISVNGGPYMYATNSAFQNYMGQRQGLSPEDIRKINLAYCGGQRQNCNGFQCSTGRCIQSSWKCDGDNDCGNWQDEQGCTRRPPCNGYQCSGGRRACIPTRWLCDGDNDCGNSEDEAYGTCLRGRLDVGGGVLPSCDLEPNFVRCNGTNATKECIGVGDRCNGKNDCGNYDDEIGCPFKDVCDGFKCQNGTCILWDQFCDGAQDCNGGEDEQKCKKSR